MILADVLTWFLIVLGSYLLLVCDWLAAYALFPGAVEASAERYRRRPVAVTLVGLVVLAPLVVIALGLAGAVPRPGLAQLLRGSLLLLLLPALLGSSGLALRIGTGLKGERDVAQPWRRVLRGGLVLAPTFLLPLLGWFVLLPWTLVSGFGSVVMGLVRRDGPAAARHAPPNATPEPS